ncbi:hypothetical protein [Fructobacillus tropaeoli]|uniref:Uncharacterized protein n=1 Tax=Fructobacillus tropaeoli TaxID=709323 RepID=A0A3F3H1M4_9LACO|nr:hypothetical protein [Fructobacillus tropaeoli]GAP04885.1 hypothetical protein FTRO_0110200 [Fructobacillus tropaeoli]
MADTKSKNDDQSKSTDNTVAKSESSKLANSTKDEVAPTVPVMKYTKRQFVSLSSFPGPKRDLFQISLEDGKEYTLEEANAAVAAVIERMWM